MLLIFSCALRDILDTENNDESESNMDDIDRICELCGEDFMVSTVFISEDLDEDFCVRNSTDICVRCLCLYDDNTKLMVDVLDKRIAETEEAEVEDGAET